MSDHVRRDGSRWGRRTIRAGRIRWCGRDYAPAPDRGGMLAPMDGEQFVAALKGDAPEPNREGIGEYDGRLDGLRGLFYTYGRYSGSLEGLVFLHSFGDEWPGPNCVDGVFRWERWEPVASTTPGEKK